VRYHLGRSIGYRYAGIAATPERSTPTAPVEVEVETIRRVRTTEVTTEPVGSAVVSRLRHRTRVAYMRFVSGRRRGIRA
jgi:transcriptional regulator NrdR family protein